MGFKKIIFASCTIVLGLVVVLLVLYYLLDRIKRRNFPPGPPRFPILGNIPQFIMDDRHIAEVGTNQSNSELKMLKIRWAPSRGYIPRRCTQIVQRVFLGHRLSHSRINIYFFPPSPTVPTQKRKLPDARFLQAVSVHVHLDIRRLLARPKIVQKRIDLFLDGQNRLLMTKEIWVRPMSSSATSTSSQSVSCMGR
jgi:hypothetical protein